MLKSLFKRTNDLSALTLRMLLSVASIERGPRQVLGRFGRLSIALRWEDSRAKSHDVQNSGGRPRNVRSNFGKSLPDNDYPALPPPFAGIWIWPCFLACFGAIIDKQKPGQARSRATGL